MPIDSIVLDPSSVDLSSSLDVVVAGRANLSRSLARLSLAESRRRLVSSDHAIDKTVEGYRKPGGVPSRLPSEDVKTRLEISARKKAICTSDSDSP